MTSLETKLREYGQKNLLEALNQKKLSPNLIAELQSINWELFNEALECINSPPKSIPSYHPIEAKLIPTILHPAKSLKGHMLGCIVMAGGQATRLNGAQPKGLIPVSPITHKTTLQMIAEKVVSYSKAYNTRCYLAIMTSEFSHKKIEDFFVSHNYFGLEKESFSLFQQGTLPALDLTGQLIIKDGSLFTVPDGNGSVFSAFVHSPIFQEWEKAGVSHLSIINSDNPLIDPFLPNMFEPLFNGVAMTAAAVARISPEESVGLFVQQEGKTIVAEYSEIDPILAKKVDQRNNLFFKWANISFFACTLEACIKAAKNKIALHMAKKSLNGLSFWKAEYFVFDHCPRMPSFQVVPIERSFFAPLKSLQGPSSPEAVGQALLERDKERFLTLFKKTPPQNFEFSEDLYYGINSIKF